MFYLLLIYLKNKSCVCNAVETKAQDFRGIRVKNIVCTKIQKGCHSSNLSLCHNGSSFGSWYIIYYLVVNKKYKSFIAKYKQFSMPSNTQMPIKIYRGYALERALLHRHRVQSNPNIRVISNYRICTSL